MNRRKILISGGGIAGLTLAIELKRNGFEPLVIEREPGLRTEGYMMDFFGSGWDVAERLGLTDRLRAIRYPIDALEFVDTAGKAWLHVPIKRVRDALDGKYVYLRRQDLERILAERATEAGIPIHYGASIATIENRDESVAVQFEDRSSDAFSLVIGADGVHSRVRHLVFGPEEKFARFLGLYVAAFHISGDGAALGRTVKIHEDVGHMVMAYPLDGERLDATYVLRHSETGIAKEERLAFVRRHFRDAGWIAGDLLRAYDERQPMFFDSVTQIVMPEWHRARVALVGDACGCLTLLAGQGSHMAMAGAYVIAQELARHDDHRAAFAAYQAFLRPHVERRQRDAARFAGIFVPSQRSHPSLRRLALRVFFSNFLLAAGLSLFGTRSVLAGRA
ncbi:MAG TPA: FAD-dependent monooxygenase [Pseudolabrys sp.]|nr:FAD-dependent monooxygenase [Pseudolabrys sp.]